MSRLKLEMTSYLYNADDITNSFCCFEKFLAYALFLPSLIVVRHQMAEIDWRVSSSHHMGIPDPVQNKVNILPNGVKTEYLDHISYLLRVQKIMITSVMVSLLKQNFTALKNMI